MKKGTMVLGLTLILLLATVGVASAITNGQPDENNHPYVGLLVFDVYDSESEMNVPAWRCSGALIASNMVLTAGHCTDGAVAARVWFDEVVTENPDYPAGGSSAIEGTPYTNPGYYEASGKGLPGFDLRDVGIVVLDQQVNWIMTAVLPEAGLVDTLKNKADVDFVGYGVQDEHRGDGPPYWTGPLDRFYAPSQLISGKFKHSDEFMKLSLNHSQGDGGTCFGDSGGPDLLGGTNTVLAVNSYVTNYNCSGVGYSSRVDITEVLEWINGPHTP